jgi:nucleotide-binding universal stress UspA family protein
MTAPSVRTTYESLLVSRFATGQWKVDITDIGGAAGPVVGDTKSALLARTQKIGSNFLVVGFTGRKGPKEDPTILGSSADFSLRAARMPVCVVKGEKGKSFKSNEPHVFVVAVDGSDRAHACLELARSLSKEGDRIIVAHVTEGTSEAVADKGTSGTKNKFGDSAIIQRYSAYCREFSGTSAGMGANPLSSPVPMASPVLPGNISPTAAVSKPSPVASSVSSHGSTVVASSSFLLRTGSSASMTSPRASAAAAPSPRAGVSAAISPSASSAPPPAAAAKAAATPRASKAILEFQIVSRTTAPTVADCILLLADEIDADFICIGADGVGRFAAGKASKLGSTSDAIIRKARSNVIVMQETSGTFMEADAAPTSAK